MRKLKTLLKKKIKIQEKLVRFCVLSLCVVIWRFLTDLHFRHLTMHNDDNRFILLPYTAKPIMMMMIRP